MQRCVAPSTTTLLETRDRVYMKQKQTGRQGGCALPRCVLTGTGVL